MHELIILENVEMYLHPTFSASTSHCEKEKRQQLILNEEV